MNNIIPVIVMTCVILAVLRFAWFVGELMVSVCGPWGAIVVALALGWAIARDRTPVGANAAREAQDAVARASGHPCDYACKVMIASQARRQDVDAADVSQ